MSKIVEIPGIEDLTNGELNQQLEYAKSVNEDSLQKYLDRFSDRHKENDKFSVKIGTDFAPRSFSFCEYIDGRQSINGGIIFHGIHDNGGDGGAPTFSVSLTPQSGWSMHT